MNRTGLVVIGAAVAIVGYAVVYNGMSNLSSGSPAFPYGPVAIITALIPGALDTSKGGPAKPGDFPKGSHPGTPGPPRARRGKR